MMYLIRKIFASDTSVAKAELEQGKLLKKTGRKGRGKGQFNMPCGVAVTKSGDVVVADTENHRIQIFNSDGLFKYKFGTKGSELNQLSYPMCVAMTSNDTIAVTDSVNACVKIFSQNGDLLQHFKPKSVFEFPYGISISVDSFYVVTDICKHEVIVLGPNGELSHVIGCYGDGAREFDHPYFVTVNKDKQIIVSDSGNSSIKIFQFQGRLLRSFTLTDFKLPQESFVSLYGMCTDSEGNTIVICNNTVYILTRNGRLWEIITPKDGLASPKCIAFSPSGRLVVTQADYDDKHELCLFRYNTDDYKSLNMLLFYAISI
ncbi:hypothetical protein SNE40_009969 [Patella caerulea]|uniref:Uncharacterized protein n=2 Tax=Patella caerulea TaxID=87958 RepID=A0AAN8JT88_PATCE